MIRGLTKLNMKERKGFTVRKDGILYRVCVNANKKTLYNFFMKTWSLWKRSYNN
jgi:hypothetical protein